jgi:hypothetical protein
MPMKEYTHAKGFNVSSLKGVSGLYLIRNFFGNLAYIGKCDNDFKNRITSHSYGKHGKLAIGDKHIIVVIVDPTNYPLHVLEHLFIWYFAPPRNNAKWFFNRRDDEDAIVRKAIEHGLGIRDSIKNFILSFESVLIEREFDEKYLFKRYGEQEQLSSKRVDCTENDKCLCLKCLVETYS